MQFYPTRCRRHCLSPKLKQKLSWCCERDKLNKDTWKCESLYLYSAPHPFTNDILIVHILVSWYTASKPWLTDCDRSWANSWLLKIFKLQPTKRKLELESTISVRNSNVYDLRCHYLVVSYRPWRDASHSVDYN